MGLDLSIARENKASKYGLRRRSGVASSRSSANGSAMYTNPTKTC